MSPAALRAASMGAGVTVAEPLEGVVLAVSRALTAVSRAVMAAVRLASL